MSLSGKFEETIFATMIRAMIQRGLKATLIQRVEATISCDDIPVSVRKHLIEALGSTKFRESAPCVAACALQHAQYIEMRLACIRAAGRILGPQGTGEMDPSLGAGLAGLAALISEGLADEDWRIRAVAATASCSCGSAVIPRLIPLLSDSAYTVRLNSARALHELGPEGRLCLMEQMSSPDRFARETITFVLQSTGSAAMPVQPTAP
jgi:HEAT repeat protein